MFTEMGLAQGLLAGKKTAGKDASNYLGMDGELTTQAQNQLKEFLKYQGSKDALDPLQSSRTATSEVANNDILKQLYGAGGTLSRTAAEEQELASRGFSLRPEDHEAYGQASDQIAREFGRSENNLAQALASRGLSQSPMAVQGFSGVQGNKMERLGQMQRQIANDRMKSNMERLGQTRNFLAQMGNQAGNEINSQYNRQLSSENARFGQEEAKNAAAFQRLMGAQNQANEQLKQRQATQEQSDWARTLSGGIDGMGMDARAAMSIFSGGLGGGAMSGAPQQQPPKKA